MKLALAQLNPVIGDLDGNAEKIFEVCKNIKSKDVDLVITPELSLIGYPPKDLLFNPRLFEQEKDVLDKLTHRLNTIKNADIIILLSKGNLSESGTHEELLENKLQYYKLWNVQTGIR